MTPTADSLRALAERLHGEPGFAAVVAELRRGHSGTIDGTWGSSKALALAALLRAEPKLLVVAVPQDSDAEALAEDLRAFAAVAPLMLPALDIAGPEAARRKDADAFGRRLAACKSLAGLAPPKVLFASVAALLQKAPSLGRVAANTRRVAKGAELPRAELQDWLAAHGWQQRDAVEVPGEYSVRGGIVDVYPADAADPFRIEFFGDDVESIRAFAIDSQRSLQELPELELTALGAEEVAAAPADDVHVASYFPAGTWVVLAEPIEFREQGLQFRTRLGSAAAGLFDVEECWAALTKFPSVAMAALPFGSVEQTCTLHVESVERFSGDLGKLKEELDKLAPNDTVVACCQSVGEAKRVRELLGGCRTDLAGRLRIEVHRIAAGFRWVAAGMLVLSDHELFRRGENRPTATTRKRFAGKAIDSFLELRDGDFVVHLGHGIGRFRGMRMLEKHGQLEEHLGLEFADQTTVYVPASKIGLVQRYVGSSAAPPRLSKIGGTAWEKRKSAAKAAVRDLACELIDLQARREIQAGIAYPQDSEWQREFEASFPHEETPDQLSALADIRKDMESTRPMDRLLCGDVGFGKTEVAVRAAFKAADAGKQVAVLVPTTVLAQQHGRSFRERLASFPFRVEVLSRFQTKAEQKQIVADTAKGAVDILIGTHRLLSADVAFQDLGLVVIDEEQRFGVEPKERLKQLRAQVDVLTLTATPIPRTLHQSLVGIRDISNLETPPEERFAVESRVSRFDEGVIRHALVRELNRGGQAYFVHNRVKDILVVRQKLQRIVPEARITVMHGQMSEDGIERAMLEFLEKRCDVLLATTIIESGLDVPNANTIFINDGEKYGLADLHQLRGRVGRSKVRAYCYVLVDEHKTLQPEAQRRLKAIEEFAHLGAGFQIALRDLEIRGAGNILGSQQSGHIAEVGYELYCELLEAAVRTLKRLPVRSSLDITVELPWEAYFPGEWLPGERFRIDAYRRLGRVENLEQLAEFRAELQDRFGPPPPPAANLLDVAKLRTLALAWQCETIRPDDKGFLVFKFRNPRKLRVLSQRFPGEIRAVDDLTAYVPLLNPQRGNALALRDLALRLLHAPE